MTIKADKQEQVTHVDDCTNHQAFTTGTASRIMHPCPRNQARKAGQKLDNLHDGNIFLSPKRDLTQTHSIIRIHDYMDEGIKPHSIYANSGSKIEPCVSFDNYRGVMPDVQKRRLIVSRYDYVRVN